MNWVYAYTVPSHFPRPASHAWGSRSASLRARDSRVPSVSPRLRGYRFLSQSNAARSRRRPTKLATGHATRAGAGGRRQPEADPSEQPSRGRRASWRAKEVRVGRADSHRGCVGLWCPWCSRDALLHREGSRGRRPRGWATVRQRDTGSIDGTGERGTLGAGLRGRNRPRPLSVREPSGSLVRKKATTRLSCPIHTIGRRRRLRRRTLHDGKLGGKGGWSMGAVEWE